jgi:hypothetical protein
MVGLMKPRIIITIEGGVIQDITSDTEVYVHVLDIDDDKEYGSDVIADKEFVDKLLGKE